VLKKRAHYRKVFDHFDPEKVARYDDVKLQQLLKDAGIIRNKLKVKSAVTNARAFLDIQAAYGSFDKYIWDFIGGKPIQNNWETMKEVPPRTELSDALSKDLKARNFNFVGSTIIYAHMQATGMVNDHVVSCFRHEACRKMGKKMFSR
jgi:DNA-3-methyladenine glycosylase I